METTVVHGVMMSRIYSYDEIRKVVKPLLAEHAMKSASLFGSYARGEARADSDIDVLLYGDGNFKALAVFAIAEDLFEAFDTPVDVYEISELLPGEFRDTVLAEAVPL